MYKADFYGLGVGCRIFFSKKFLGMVRDVQNIGLL